MIFMKLETMVVASLEVGQGAVSMGLASYNKQNLLCLPEIFICHAKIDIIFLLQTLTQITTLGN